jgi:hydrogenase expression/formation protein HypC
MCLAIPGELKERYESDGLPMGRVDFGGLSREVCLSCVPEAEVGQYVVVHVGFALSVLDADEAARTLALLDELRALDLPNDEEGEGRDQ